MNMEDKSTTNHASRVGRRANSLENKINPKTKKTNSLANESDSNVANESKTNGRLTAMDADDGSYVNNPFTDDPADGSKDSEDLTMKEVRIWAKQIVQLISQLTG